MRSGRSGRAGQRPLPGDALLDVEGRRPERLGSPEGRRLEPRLGEERRPVGLGVVGRGRVARLRLLELRRHDVERDQPAPQVVARAAHPCDELRRIAPGDAPPQVLRCERPRTLPIPEREDRRLAGGERAPARRGAVALLRPPEVVDVGVEAHLRVDGLHGRVAREELARPVLERGRALLDRDSRDQLARSHERRQQQHAHRHEREAPPARPRAQPLGVAGRGDELGRRRLARRDRSLERVAAGQHRRRGERRGRALARLLLQAREDRALDARVEAPNQRRGLDRPLVAVLARELGEALALERPPAGDELVDHEAERIDVAADAHLAPEQLLGRHVGGRPRPHVLARQRVGQPGQPEVGEPNLPPAVEHHVRGLQVAVQQALRVRGAQPLGDLARHVERLVEREAPDAPEQRREVLSVHELHREEVLPLGLSDVPHAADGRVRHLARGAHLGVEPLDAVAVGLEGGRQELERDRLLELEVVGAVDLAHPAAAQQAHDPVAIGEDRSRHEAISGSGARGAAPSSASREASTSARASRARPGAVPVGFSGSWRSIPHTGQ